MEKEKNMIKIINYKLLFEGEYLKGEKCIGKGRKYDKKVN